MGEGNWVDHAHAETLSGLFRTSCPWRLLLLLCGATAAFMAAVSVLSRQRGAHM